MVGVTTRPHRGVAMKRSSVTHPIAAGLMTASLLITSLFAAAHAQTTSAAADTAEAQTEAIAPDDSKLQSDTTRFCPRETGTRIVARHTEKSRCTTFGRVYSSEDLQRTGEVDLGAALRKLDPAIR